MLKYQPEEDHMELVIVLAGAVAMLVVSLGFQRASYKKMVPINKQFPHG